MERPSATSSVDWPHGWHVRVVDETGSTNADLLAAAASGAPHRSVLAARHQTAGRGRLDRRWEAHAGANLLVSLLFTEVPDHAHELTQRVALAAADAAATLAGADVRLKWPNDLLLDGRKLAGVLAQSTFVDGRRVVVVGIGVNVGGAPPDAAMLGGGLDPMALLAERDTQNRPPLRRRSRPERSGGEGNPLWAAAGDKRVGPLPSPFGLAGDDGDGWGGGRGADGRHRGGDGSRDGAGLGDVLR